MNATIFKITENGYITFPKSSNNTKKNKKPSLIQSNKE
jgi:hypothetical protein